MPNVIIAGALKGHSDFDCQPYLIDAQPRRRRTMNGSPQQRKSDRDEKWSDAAGVVPTRRYWSSSAVSMNPTQEYP